MENLDEIRGEKNERHKLKPIIFAMTALVAIIFYCCSKNVQVYANTVAEAIYPEYVFDAGDRLAEIIEEYTVGSDKNAGEQIDEQIDKQHDNHTIDEETAEMTDKYISCRNSELRVSTKKNYREIDEAFFDDYFYGINESYRSDEIHAVLSEKIYSQYNTQKRSRPINLKRKKVEIQEAEDNLLNNIVTAKKQTPNTSQWNYYMPTSDDWLEICYAREALIEEGYHDFEFAYYLANNYQKLGDEYKKISNYTDEVFEDYDGELFYYCQSIDADKMALAFAKNKDQKATCLERIATRYHDIADEEGINQTARNAATLIYKQIKQDMKQKNT